MRSYLLVDLEFTTYNKPVGRPRGFFSEIIEIGAVKLDENLKVCGTLQAFGIQLLTMQIIPVNYL